MSSTAGIHVEVLYLPHHLDAVWLREAGRHCCVMQEHLADRKFQEGGFFRRTRAPLLPGDDLQRAAVDAEVGFCGRKERERTRLIRGDTVILHLSEGW